MRGGRLGPGNQDDKEATMLSRLVFWTSHGLENEADPRKAGKLLEAMFLDGAKSVATPGFKPLADQILQEHPLAEKHYTDFRALDIHL